MKVMRPPAMLAGLLLAVLTLAPASALDLGPILPGLNGPSLCPTVKNSPQILINAIASGGSQAYDQGAQAQSSYAQLMAQAVMCANQNGCINEMFEILNQAMLKAGSKVEFITGKTIAIGTAQGTASLAGEVLAKATAVVICRGGASAQACARAWNQAVRIDPKNGCPVLIKAYVHARAYCKDNKAVTDVKSGVYKTALGSCDTSSLYNSNGGYNYGGGSNTGYGGGSNTGYGGGSNSNYGGSNNGYGGGSNSGNGGGYNPYNTGPAWVQPGYTGGGGSPYLGSGISVSQGPGGQQVSFPGGGTVYQNAGGQSFGRKMLADQDASLAGSSVISSHGSELPRRRLHGAASWQIGRATSTNSGAAEQVAQRALDADPDEGY